MFRRYLGTFVTKQKLLLLISSLTCVTCIIIPRSGNSGLVSIKLSRQLGVPTYLLDNLGRYQGSSTGAVTRLPVVCDEVGRTDQEQLRHILFVVSIVGRNRVMIKKNGRHSYHIHHLGISST